MGEKTAVLLDTGEVAYAVALIGKNGLQVSNDNPMPVSLAVEPTVNIGIISIADGGDAAQGAKGDAAASWYPTAASVLSVLKLAVAALVGAGSHVYTYTNGVLTTDAWTLLGTLRTKTYTYTTGVLTGESDWV